MPGPDLEIRWGPGHPDPYKRGGEVGGGLQKLIVLNVLKVAELKWFKMLVVYNPQSVNTQHTTRRKGKIAAKADCNH